MQLDPRTLRPERRVPDRHQGGFEGVLNKPDTVLFIGIGCNIRVNWVQVSGLPLPNHMTLSK